MVDPNMVPDPAGSGEMVRRDEGSNRKCVRCHRTHVPMYGRAGYEPKWPIETDHCRECFILVWMNSYWEARMKVGRYA